MMRLLAGLLVMFPPASQAGNIIGCIENTGGGCVTSDCFPWRGPTRCDGGRCFCTGGTCSGADGICSNEPYIGVANGTHYKIKNARWPEYYMDVEGLGGVKVEKSGHDETDNKFTFSMPTYEGGQEALTAPLFLMASVRWPDAVVRLTKSNSDSRRRTSEVWNAECKNVDGHFGGLGNDPPIHDLGMNIRLAPLKSSDGDQPLMLSPSKYPDMYLYVSSMGWGVQGHRSDPGAGGYWYFEPSLPEDLKKKLLKYSGPRCSTSCGDVRNVDATTRMRSAVAPLLALVAGLVGASLPA